MEEKKYVKKYKLAKIECPRHYKFLKVNIILTEEMGQGIKLPLLQE